MTHQVLENGIVRDATPAEVAEIEERKLLALVSAPTAIETVQRQRAAAYPPIGDQLDALWKGGDAAAEMLAQVQAVKAQYPKPE
jgi:hypothetical protein